MTVFFGPKVSGIDRLDNTVEPLYCGHHWDSLNCPDFRGVLISEVHYIIVLYTVVAFGTMKSVLI